MQQTCSAPDVPIEMNFFQSGNRPSPFVSRGHKRHCRACGAGTSRKAAYCSGCGHELGILASRELVQRLILIASALAIAAIIMACSLLFVNGML